MATHSSTLAWRIPWTEEPGGLQSMGSHRVRYNWTTNTFTFLNCHYVCQLYLCKNKLLIVHVKHPSFSAWHLHVDSNLLALRSVLIHTHSYCCSVTTLCPTLCNSIDCSTPGFPFLHHLPEFAQTHVHWVGDAIQPSCLLSPPSSCPCSLTASGSFPMSLKQYLYPNPLSPYLTEQRATSSKNLVPILKEIVIITGYCLVL